MTRHARIELRPADDPRTTNLKPSARPHYLRLVAANGQVLAHSETYSTRANARRAVESWLDAMSEVVILGMHVEYDTDGRWVR